SLFHLTMAGVLLWLTARGLVRTHRLQLYLIAYGVFRFLTEYLRPEPDWFGGLSYYQWVAVVLIVGPAVQWWWGARRDSASPAPPWRCSYSGRRPFGSSYSSAAGPHPGSKRGRTMPVRDYTFRGLTKSLCPHCRRVVEAKIIVRDGRVYFRKRCPEHGVVEDF